MAPIPDVTPEVARAEIIAAAVAVSGVVIWIETVHETGHREMYAPGAVGSIDLDRWTVSAELEAPNSFGTARRFRTVRGSGDLLHQAVANAVFEIGNARPPVRPPEA